MWIALGVAAAGALWAWQAGHPWALGVPLLIGAVAPSDDEPPYGWDDTLRPLLEGRRLAPGQTFEVGSSLGKIESDTLASAQEAGALLKLDDRTYLYAVPDRPASPGEERALRSLAGALRARARGEWRGVVERADEAALALEGESLVTANRSLIARARRRLSAALLSALAEQLYATSGSIPAALRAKITAARYYLSQRAAAPADGPSDKGPSPTQAAALRALLDALAADTVVVGGRSLDEPEKARLLGILGSLAQRKAPSSPRRPPPLSDDLKEGLKRLAKHGHWKRRFKTALGYPRAYPGMRFSFPSDKDQEVMDNAARGAIQSLRMNGLESGSLLRLSNDSFLYAAGDFPSSKGEQQALARLADAVHRLGQLGWDDVLFGADDAVRALESASPAAPRNLGFARDLRRRISAAILLERIWRQDARLNDASTPEAAARQRTLTEAMPYLRRAYGAEGAMTLPSPAEAAAFRAALDELKRQGIDVDDRKLAPELEARAIEIFALLAERPAGAPEATPSGSEPKLPTDDAPPQASPRHAPTVPAAQPSQASRLPSIIRQSMLPMSSLETAEPAGAFTLDARRFPNLTALGRNLTALAAQGKLDPLIGRRTELEQIARALMRRRKPNPLLIGPPGSGKTAIVEGLAQAIVAGLLPALGSRVIVQLDLAELLSDTKHLGELEKKIKGVLKEAAALRGRLSLFIDETHMLIGLGKVEDGASDVANLLKPALANGELSVIGGTTPEEHRRMRKDGALARRFKTVPISPVDAAQTLEILRGLLPGLERHHGLAYAPGTPEAAVRIAERHLKHLTFPDKAIDLIDEAGSRARLAGRAEAGEGDVAAVAAEWTRTPAGELTATEADRLRTLAARVKARVIDQDGAVDAVVAALKEGRMGLREANKLAGAFLLLGPCGVGKTELARVLAEETGMNLVRLDGSDYGERGAASRLVGAAPGLLGHDEPGALTEAVKNQPRSLVLFDELEEANGKTRKLLLQVMDEGRLTDAHGEAIDFSHALLLMTSNLGGQTAPPPGEEAPGRLARLRRETEKRLEPKFLERLDALIVMDPLRRSALERILDLRLAALNAALAPRRIALSLTAAARELLLRLGFSDTTGARPLKRALADHVSKPLAAALVDGAFAPGDAVEADAESGWIVLRRLAPASPR